MAEQWRVVGDFVDFCKCPVPCPCTFGRPPTEGDCDGVIAFRIRQENYGDVKLDGLNVVGVAHFEGNIWEDATRADMGMIVDERADDAQREAIGALWGGQAGGWLQLFAENMVGEMLGMEFAPIDVQIDEGLETWSVEVPGKVKGNTTILTGPTSRPGERIAVRNAPGSEVGPYGGDVTYGIADANETDAFGLKWDWAGRSSKHIPFEWSSDDKF